MDYLTSFIASNQFKTTRMRFSVDPGFSLVADRKINPRFLKILPVSSRRLCLIKGITLTILDFQAAILLP